MSVNRWLESSPVPAVWLFGNRYISQRKCVESLPPSARQGNLWLKQHEDHCSWNNFGAHHTVHHVPLLHIWHTLLSSCIQHLYEQDFAIKKSSWVWNKRFHFDTKIPHRGFLLKARGVKGQKMSSGGDHLSILPHRHSMNSNNTLTLQFIPDL